MNSKLLLWLAGLIGSHAAMAQFFPIATGAVPFGDSRRNLRADSTNFLWDNTAKQLTLGFGTAAAPAYSFTGDADNGMYHSDTNELSFSTNGVQRLQITASGEVHATGPLTTASSLTPTGGIVGVGTATDASTGLVGEYVSANAPAVNIGSSSTLSVATATLTAGDWDVDGSIQFINGVTSVTQALTAAISLTNNAVDVTNANNLTQLYGSWSNTLQQWVPIPTRRVSIATTTPVFLVGQVQATTYGTNMAIGNSSIIRARRVR